MNPVLNYAKKITVPSQRLQKEKQQVAKKVCGLINEAIGKYNQIVGFDPTLQSLNLAKKFAKENAKKIGTKLTKEAFEKGLEKASREAGQAAAKELSEKMSQKA